MLQGAFQDSLEREVTGEHYKAFSDVYCTNTSEEHRPSLSKSTHNHGMPLSPSVQAAKNVMKVLFCTKCTRPRVLHAARKVKQPDKEELELALQDLHYSCGSTLQEMLDKDEEQGSSEPASTGVVAEADTHQSSAVLSRVFIRGDLTCSDHVELPYFSAAVFPDVCIYCGSNEKVTHQPETYPTCEFCSTKKRILKRKRSVLADSSGKAVKKMKKAATQLAGENA